jgi:hypothetical protein
MMNYDDMDMFGRESGAIVPSSQGEFRSSSKNFIVGAHPHGVFSFCGVCAAV